MVPDLVCHHLSENHVVLELDEHVTAPARAIELHVVRDSETGDAIAWWEDDNGIWLGVAVVGRT